MSTEYQLLNQSYSYNQLATKEATVQRNTDGTGHAAHLSSLAVSPLYPVTGDTLEDAGLSGAAREYKRVFIRKQVHKDDSVTVDQLPDITEGDNLIISGVTYPIRAVEEWEFILMAVVSALRGSA